jgi:hypothetical protein
MSSLHKRIILDRKKSQYCITCISLPIVSPTFLIESSGLEFLLRAVSKLEKQRSFASLSPEYPRDVVAGWFVRML